MSEYCEERNRLREVYCQGVCEFSQGYGIMQQISGALIFDIDLTGFSGVCFRQEIAMREVLFYPSVCVCVCYQDNLESRVNEILQNFL